MKKLTLFILFAVVSICVSAQKVQSHFFGYEFGSSMSYMIDAMSENGYYVIKKDETLFGSYDVKFGGLSWSFVDFSYYEDQLFRVLFSQPSKSKREALNRFNYLREQLKSKYKGICYDDELNELGIKGLIATDLIRSLILEISYSTSPRGERMYYVKLSYYYNELLSKAVGESQNEL